MPARQFDEQMPAKLQLLVIQMRIIVGAMTAGLVMFLLMMTMMDLMGNGGNAGGFDNPLVLAAIVAAISALIASRVVAAAIVRRGRKQLASGELNLPAASQGQDAWKTLAELGDAGKMASIYPTQMIVSAAIREGAGFIATLMFMLTGSWIALGLAILMAASIVALWPTASGVAAWVEDQLRLVDNEKQLAS